MSGTPIVASRKVGSDRFASPAGYLQRLSVHKFPNRERTPNILSSVPRHAARSRFRAIYLGAVAGQALSF